MRAALYDEREGYYSADRVRQGRAGDYRTAPEISPLFAATFASYFAKLFGELGSPNRFTIVEVGAGSGKFAHGVLTTLRAERPQVFNATRYVIDEISEASRARCAARLAEFAEHVNVRSLSLSEGNFGNRPAHDAPNTDSLTGIIFSNELIDAFPVNRVVMHDGRLRQLYVGLNEDAFVWIEGALEKSVANYCEPIRPELEEGQILEINLDAESFIASAAGLLKRGYVITVDYGAERDALLGSPDRHGGTLRAFHRHRFAEDVLTKAGEQDLTTTVDWTQIREAGERAGLQTVKFEQLDQFLIAEGLLDRLGEITRSVTDPAEQMRLATSARELILPTGMAASFQVLVQEKCVPSHAQGNS